MTHKTDANRIAYRKLKPRADRTYPYGRFIAISGGKIIADAADLTALRREVAGQGKTPRETLVFQAGVNYPDNVTIFV
jgi:hypothetical protein